jgi:hypothetical protein
MVGVAGAVLILLVGYLRDPPWLGSVSSGFGVWEHSQREQIRFRWMGAHASFFVPSDWTVVRIPLRGLLLLGDTREFIVTIHVNDQPVATVHLPDEQWHTAEIRLSEAMLRGRRHVRIDLRVNRTWGPGLGVQVGEARTAGAT